MDCSVQQWSCNVLEECKKSILVNNSGIWIPSPPKVPLVLCCNVSQWFVDKTINQMQLDLCHGKAEIFYKDPEMSPVKSSYGTG